jgi:hypothetical protein
VPINLIIIIIIITLIKQILSLIFRFGIRQYNHSLYIICTGREFDFETAKKEAIFLVEQNGERQQRVNLK